MGEALEVVGIRPDPPEPFLRILCTYHVTIELLHCTTYEK